MEKTAAQEAYYNFVKAGWAIGPWDTDKSHFERMQGLGTGSVKKEYMRLRDLAHGYPKWGNKSKFKRFQELTKATGKYPTDIWEQEEPSNFTAATGIRLKSK